MPWNLPAQKNITISSIDIINFILGSAPRKKTENNEKLRDVLKSSEIKEITENISLRYKNLAEIDELYKFGSSIHYKHLTAKDLSFIYEKFRNEKSMGKYFLDSISRGICLFCLIDSANEIDHYLPKETFPELSIQVYNLIPSCSACNKSKSTHVPESKGTQLIHPYFNKIDFNSRWMYSYPNEKFPQDPSSRAIVFEVICDNEFINKPDKERLKNHFYKLKLNDRYDKKVRDELFTVYKLLSGLPDVEKNAECRKEYLYEISEQRKNEAVESGEYSYKGMGDNWWKSVFLEGLAESEWYCEEGYKILAEKIDKASYDELQ